MFKDQKNIIIKVVSWLLLAIFVSNMHYLCLFIYLDVLHINRLVQFSVAGKEFSFFIKDLFMFYDAKEAAALDIQYYLFFLGSRISAVILSYLLLSAIGALSVLMDITVKGINLYKRVYILTKVYLFIQLYNLLSYILCAGQFLHGLPLAIYLVCVMSIFFFRRTETGWEFKAEI